MTNITISYINRADAGTVTASDAVTGLAADNVQTPVVAKRWRVTSTTPWLEVDFGSAVEIGALALVFPRDTSFPTGADTVRHRLSAVAAGDGELLDTGAQAIGTVEGYGVHVHLLSAAVDAQYWRVDLSAPSLSTQGFIDLGRAWAGPAWVPELNMDYGWRRAWADSSALAEAEKSGAQYVRAGAQRRTVEVAFGFMTEDDAEEAEEMQRLAGLNGQALVIPKPDKAGRTALVGRMRQVVPIGQPHFDRYATGIRIEESL